jgi:capsular exopolysaccharide synthesis family protein
MVTSAEEKEGKTAVATQLAISLARAGRKVLLVDGDMHQPRLHQVFDRPPTPGLREVLLGEVAPDLGIQPSGVQGLSLLTNQPWQCSPLLILSSGSARALFAWMRSRFDLIVVDSAPILPVPDPLLLARLVDGVLFSVLRDVSRLPAIRAAHDRLHQLGIPMLGVVVNGVHQDSYGYSYYTRSPEV